MAEAVLFNLATDILKLAGSITFSEIQLVRGARDELDSLKDTMETIRAVLLDAEKQQWHNNQVKLWLARLKDVLYDVQDLLDDVATEDLRRKVTPGDKMSKAVRIFFSKSNQLAHTLKVANKIQELRKKLDRIKNDREFRLEEHQREETMAIGRGKKTAIFAPDRAIIGRKEDKKKIKQLLFDSSSSQSVSFVAIVGKGGLGKTALARLVYNDGEVEKHFDLKMWVCVSDVFNVNVIIKEILKSAKDNCRGHDDEMKELLQDLENKPIDQLLSLLHEILGRKTYLLVLDDLWNEDRDKWLKLGDWLEGGLRGSKILVTTRSHKVAKVTDAKSVIHVLNGLSEDKSWDLFRKMAFGDGVESSDPELEETGRDIVKKCAGVPLAIRTIGGLLYGKNKYEWLRYKVRELPEIPEIDEVDDGIMQVLKFSYGHLPSCLKHCFAYCSLFPKDYVYDKEMLIHLWMAQGFVESLNGEDNLEEVADNYLLELLCRSFLDATRKKDNGEVVTFKMHDLMHDLAQKVAGGECKIINFKGGDNDRGIRHASLFSETFSEEKMVSLLKTSKLRTFLYLGGKSSVLNSLEVFSRCRHCRALVLQNTDIPLPPSSFGKLKQLRFLYIYANQYIQSLPDSITDLVNLQILKLVTCVNLKTFPRDLRRLVNLRYLLIVECSSLSHLPPLSELPSLRTLFLKDLDALEFLQHTSDPEQSDITRPFFQSLEKLSLCSCSNLKGWWGRRQLVTTNQDHPLYDSESSFPKLLAVEIQGCPHLNSMPLFPWIENLHIDGDNTKLLEQQMMFVPNCPSKEVVSTLIPFSRLKNLNFVAVGDLEHMLKTLLRFLSNIESMSLYNCVKLRSLSRGMRYLSSLQHLNIRACEELDLSSHDDKHGIQWRSLTKLRGLGIGELPKLVTLPVGIQHVTTLQFLKLEGCQNLTSLPEWIGNFSSLEELEIIDCPGLMCLPDGMRRLTSLKKLTIVRCPTLEERCRTESGADWEKVSKGVCVFFFETNQLGKTLDRIENNKDFHLEPHLSEAAAANARRRTTHSFACEEDIIGREEDKKEIIAHLFDSSSRESVSVVYIVGLGGIGKTAVAQLVYNDDKVNDYFQLKMWVCVSDVFDEDLIIKEILKSAQDELQGDLEMRNFQDIENKSEDQLQSLLSEILDGKKYLLVLDDLWNEDGQRWLELQCLLMGSPWGSKILVTTRNQSVVQATNMKSVIYGVHGLSEDKSWNLFKIMASGDGEESLDPRLEIGRDIVKKCNGFPLAIKIIGSLLFPKSEKEWLYFKEHELSKIDNLDHGIMEVLKLSYDHLPSQLKRCFAYCALFPKDYVIDKHKMIQLWMTEGLIESLDENEDLEEIGDSYVSDLLYMSFLEVEEVDYYTGGVEMFKMHDLMHDLALKVAGEECKMVDLNEGNIDGEIKHASFARMLLEKKY